MSTAIATVVAMLESLPAPAQEQVVEHLREYVEELRDELKWDTLVAKTQRQLVAAARRAKEEIAAGRSEPLDENKL